MIAADRWRTARVVPISAQTGVRMTMMLLGLWSLLLVGRGTPIGNWLHRKLVVAPAAWLSSWTRGQVLLLGAVVAAALFMLLVLGREGALFASFALTDASAMLAQIEITAGLDALVTVATVASVTRSGQAIRWLRMRFAPRTVGRRAARTPRRPRPRPPANDEDGPAFLAA